MSKTEEIVSRSLAIFFAFAGVLVLFSHVFNWGTSETTPFHTAIISATLYLLAGFFQWKQKDGTGVLLVVCGTLVMLFLR